tara:strand:- start:531 stop:764 length:234 start_codon:yes stop_codon:yes gene_type:complete
MNVKDIFRKETGEHIEIEKEFNDGVFVDVYNENYIAWLESKVKKLNIDDVSKCGECESLDTLDYIYCKDCLEFTPKN